MNTLPFGLGASESAKDYRTLEHTKVGAPQIKAVGGKRHPKEKILHQRKIGKCTAISVVQNVFVATGVLYSDDFQYMMQKINDGNWLEGSSPFSSVKTAHKVGMLPAKYFPSITDANPDITYDDYVKRLQKIANNPAKLAELKALCERPISGYSLVNVKDDTLLAQAISDSKAGLIARFTIGAEWWTNKKGEVSWSKDDIQPLRPCTTVVSGHQTSVTDFNYETTAHICRTANTWSAEWCDDGSANFDLSKVRPTEAWMLYFDHTPNYVKLPDPATWSHTFIVPMQQGAVSDHVKALQVKLMLEDCMERVTEAEWGTYGKKTAAAVLAFQLKRKIPLSYYERYVLRGSQVGPKTLKELNK